jgi:hypothetical protein
MQQQQTDGHRAQQQRIESKISEDLKSEDAWFFWKGWYDMCPETNNEFASKSIFSQQKQQLQS